MDIRHLELESRSIQRELRIYTGWDALELKVRWQLRERIYYLLQFFGLKVTLLIFILELFKSLLSFHQMCQVVAILFFISVCLHTHSRLSVLKLLERNIASII